MEASLALFAFCVLALAFGFLDGYHGSANVVATVVYSRAMSLSKILALAAAGVVAGPFLFGVAVAETIGQDLANPRYFTLPVTTAAVLAAIAWKAVTARLGVPASASHTLVGGLVGAVVAGNGISVLQTEGLLKVTVALALSPAVGLSSGYLMMRLLLFLLRGATPRVNVFFRRAQLLTAVTLALSHGSSNAQKTMGIITLGLVATGYSQSFTVPLWVTAASAAAMGLGTLFGGQRIIRTVGGFYKIRPIHGFTSQLTAATVILVAALLGGPVSSTQTVSSAIIGVGSAERFSKVRWTVFYDIAVAWLLTVPVTMLLAGLLYLLMSGLGSW